MKYAFNFRLQSVQVSQSLKLALYIYVHRLKLLKCPHRKYRGTVARGTSRPGQIRILGAEDATDFDLFLGLLDSFEPNFAFNNGLP